MTLLSFKLTELPQSGNELQKQTCQIGNLLLHWHSRLLRSEARLHFVHIPNMLFGPDQP